MAPDQDPPARPRRERPLVAPGRERPTDASPPLTATTPPTGPPVIEFAPVVGSPERDDRVQVSFEGPTPQRRWTVALRFFLAVPHFIWWYLLGIALSLVGFISWFAALFTARVPEGMARFMTNVVRYQARLFAYSSLLLTDHYPPFEFDTDYAVNVSTNPGRLNRAAVFFRMILVLPSAFVSTLALIGAGLVGVVGWLLALILGRLPTPLWEANAAVLRYYTRAQAFALMLTAEQPSGLFGDKGEAPLPLADAPAVPDLPASPRITRLRLSAAARRLVVLFIVLAVTFYVGVFTLAAITGVKTAKAISDLHDSHERLSLAVGRFNSQAQGCAIEGGLECLHAADEQLAQAFDSFVDEVSAISFPGNLDPSPLLGDAQDCSAALRRMAAAQNATDYGIAYSQYQTSAQIYLDDYSQFDYDARYN